MERAILARSESSEPKTGSPSPSGTFNATHSTTPPRLSPFPLISMTFFFISSAILGSGDLTSLEYRFFLASSRVKPSALRPPSSDV
jgi:hypothetical protein